MQLQTRQSTDQRLCEQLNEIMFAQSDSCSEQEGTVLINYNYRSNHFIASLLNDQHECYTKQRSINVQCTLVPFLRECVGPGAGKMYPKYVPLRNINVMHVVNEFGTYFMEKYIFFYGITILRKIFLANAWKCFREVLMIICEGDSEMRIVVVSASLWRFLDLLTNTEY